MLSEGAWRRVLWIASGLFFGVAAVIVLAVIPSVKSDASPAATPERAVPAFTVNMVLQALLGAVLLALAARQGGRPARVALSVTGLLGLLLGLFLLDASDAYAGHGPGMHGATLALLGCVVADWCAAVPALAAAFLRGRSSGDAASV
jgi:hypothetical protein